MKRRIRESGGDHAYPLEDIVIEGQRFEVFDIIGFDTPDFISRSIALKHEDWDDLLPIVSKSETLAWDEEEDCLENGYVSVKDMEASDIADELPIDYEKLLKRMTLKRIQRIYEKETGSKWEIQGKLFGESLIERLLDDNF